VTEVAWVPLAALRNRLAYADERKLAEKAQEILAGTGQLADGVPE
ncbi:MAG: NUDIX hydrolase, partial [Haloechinothrix sp.]